MTKIEQIKGIIEGQYGGLDNFSAFIKRTKKSERPSKANMLKCLQVLSNEELNVAWHLGLIGNNSVEGSIIKNAFCKSKRK